MILNKLIFVVITTLVNGRHLTCKLARSTPRTHVEETHVEVNDEETANVSLALSLLYIPA